MARISSSDRTKTDKHFALASASSRHGEGNDCSVKAVAVVCGITYDEAHNALRLVGRKHRGAAHTHVINEIVESFGFKVRPVCMGSVIESYPKAHRILQSVTTHHPKRFAKIWANDPALANSLIYSRGHVSAVANGELHDWAAGRALRATEIYSVTKIQP